MLGWKTLRPTEPSYRGRRLSEWLDEYNRAGSPDKTGPVSEAIRAMGTNSLPFLLANMEHSDSPLSRKFFSLVQKQNWVKLPVHEPDSYRLPSIMAPSALGSNAAPIFPNLLRFSENASNCAWGASALLAIGPSSIPTLAKLCQSENEAVRSEAALTIATLKAGHGFFWAWQNAPMSSGGVVLILPSATFNVVAELLELLANPDPAVRRASADAIRSYGSPFDQIADWAVKPLVKALKDPDAAVRLSAGQALTAIDPIAAAKAGVK
ncbi:MAG TPA: HEAT repeat domain-containing protein [Candidatus Cybelea sp.]|nr:HEAT repeat domain-containing protein [Candidatus Cybelea sp.]